MQRKRLKMVFRVVLLCMAVTSCSFQEIELKETFLEEVKSNYDTKKVIDFSNTKFDWHKLYFFESEYRDENISLIIGFDWSGKTVPDFSHRFFFVDTLRKKGYYFDLENENRIWVGCLLKQYYTHETALFYSKSASEENTYVDYYVSPIECDDLPKDTTFYEYSHHG